MWSVGCSSWLMWFWIFNNICRKKMLDKNYWQSENCLRNSKNHFKVALRIRTIEPTWWNTFSKNGDKHCQIFYPPPKPFIWQTLTLQQIVWKAKIAEELSFIVITKKMTQKCLRISGSFLLIFLWTWSLLFHQALMLRDIFISKCH